MSEPAASSFTGAGVRRGFLAAQPLTPGVFIYAMVFGVLASERGLAWFQSMLMSAFVYSGTAQLAVLQGWRGDVLVSPLVATILVINARYVLYGAALRPWLASCATRPQAMASLFVMGDGNWALSMREYHAGYRDAGFVLGSGLSMFAPWVGGTLAGQFLGHSVPDPAMLGLDFMLPAFAAAIAVVMWRGRGDLLPAIAAALVAFAMHRWVPGAWYIVAAGLAAGLAGAWLHER